MNYTGLAIHSGKPLLHSQSITIDWKFSLRPLPTTTASIPFFQPLSPNPDVDFTPDLQHRTRHANVAAVLGELNPLGLANPRLMTWQYQDRLIRGSAILVSQPCRQ
ncbi:hypothetical protein Mfla_0207 [Methylobacillus flagellatus KT]|uniref:Uncharacterized protein n=1 Tax=Methylobacillus flagellatus (strain ATCC 51484 / DSM 6875 / VKM B-1610 / KT) TaxID=265072 RepID=Q1H4V9_METFK|nr:hypothetical protein Mfla_0207 [Methylobacillus flagellatus KT]